MRRTTIYVRELDLTVARWQPGFLGFVRWLFTPFQPPPLLPEISLDDEPEIRAYLERQRLQDSARQVEGDRSDH